MRTDCGRLTASRTRPVKAALACRSCPATARCSCSTASPPPAAIAWAHTSDAMRVQHTTQPIACACAVVRVRVRQRPMKRTIAESERGDERGQVAEGAGGLVGQLQRLTSGAHVLRVLQDALRDRVVDLRRHLRVLQPELQHPRQHLPAIVDRRGGVRLVCVRRVRCGACGACACECDGRG